MSSDSRTELVGLPKAELHVHLEGTLEPEDLLRFAERNDVSLPWHTPESVRAAYRYQGLGDFLTLYWQGCQVLRTRADFYDLAAHYLRRASRQGVRWVELSFAPQNFLPRGIGIDDQLEPIVAAFDDARTAYGIDGGIIVVAQRHQPEAEALRLLDLIRPYRAAVLGLGFGGPELPHPPSTFEQFFTAARAEGYRLTAHAGEEGPPDYIRQALDCGVERIDHGYAAKDDDDLLRRFAERSVPVTLCPLSNLRLGVTAGLDHYPVRRFLAAGVPVSINSDDPPYFGGDLTANYRAVTDALRLDDGIVRQLARNSFTGAFAPEGVRAAGLEAIARWGGTG